MRRADLTRIDTHEHGLESGPDEVRREFAGWLAPQRKQRPQSCLADDALPIRTNVREVEIAERAAGNAGRVEPIELVTGGLLILIVRCCGRDANCPERKSERLSLRGH